MFDSKKKEMLENLKNDKEYIDELLKKNGKIVVTKHAGLFIGYRG